MATNLRLDLKRPMRPVTNAECAEVHTWGAALRRCVDLSGLSDKVVAAELDIDRGQFSKTMSGQIGIMPEKLDKLQEICGNRFPDMWRLYGNGYDIESLHRRETELERELRISRERIAELERDNETITRFIRAAKVIA